MGVLWYGGTIYTMRKEYEEIESVFTKNGKIVDVGPVKDLRDKYKDEIDKEQDLDGKTMFPGFVDSHLHIVGHGEKILHLDLSVMNSAEEVLNALSSRAKQLGDGEWLIGEGWNENQWAQPRMIRKEELDEMWANSPMMLTRIGRHAA